MSRASRVKKQRDTKKLLKKWWFWVVLGGIIAIIITISVLGAFQFGLVIAGDQESEFSFIARDGVSGEDITTAIENEDGITAEFFAVDDGKLGSFKNGWTSLANMTGLKFNRSLFSEIGERQIGVLRVDTFELKHDNALFGTENIGNRSFAGKDLIIYVNGRNTATFWQKPSSTWFTAVLADGSGTLDGPGLDPDGYNATRDIKLDAGINNTEKWAGWANHMNYSESGEPIMLNWLVVSNGTEFQQSDLGMTDLNGNIGITSKTRINETGFMFEWTFSTLTNTENTFILEISDNIAGMVDHICLRMGNTILA